MLDQLLAEIASLKARALPVLAEAPQGFAVPPDLAAVVAGVGALPIPADATADDVAAFHGAQLATEYLVRFVARLSAANP